LKPYIDTVREVLAKGTRKTNRTGVDTLSTFNINYEIDLREGFPLLTTKEISWKNIVVENLWFLSGDTHIGLLQKHKCKFWDPWADETGKVPSAYGNFWRHFPIHDARRQRGRSRTRSPGCSRSSRRNPMSRRLVVSAWAPGNAQTSKLPPCHCLFMFNVQLDATGEPLLNLHLTQSSCDVALGVPYNIAGYALMLELFARFSGIPAGSSRTRSSTRTSTRPSPTARWPSTTTCPGFSSQLERTPRSLPRSRSTRTIRALADIKPLLEATRRRSALRLPVSGYDPHPAIAFKVAV
jgi:thymidylate synthase